ncbi:nitroreductase family protein [Serratia ficaria]|uniref:Malonic semialdehyde reductase n=1 Tax=Serratia ficaria TaxID=61651 RepID=A0A240C8A7_SERFI|nr:MULTISPECIES: nitroreductase family protein [Serratia]MEE4481530.1 nitroreductase family protein [Serratia ficaria]REF44007.1 nitroreductase [Serratia ficaria]CAI0728043.1 malonic semialdehyde reductase [Serratia ficaria]CAI0731678.1 malonic semialdehyde reductase [Serratia ficaria]CAI0748902.1 malonic semialdehyde reductase [Serratia ficaria]
MSQPRIPDYPIDAQFIERWSPRALANDPLDDETLLSFFEAARWSPSAYNIQPWRFAYSKHGSDSWEDYLEFLIEFNRSWAQHASALVVIISKTTSVNGEQEVGNPSHSFDTGAAWANLAQQAHLKGWLTHCMGGVHHDKIKAALKLPDNYVVHGMVAIGKPGDKSRLPDFLQDKEIPSGRLQLEKTVIEGLNFSL